MTTTVEEIHLKRTDSPTSWEAKDLQRAQLHVHNENVLAQVLAYFEGAPGAPTVELPNALSSLNVLVATSVDGLAYTASTVPAHGPYIQNQWFMFDPDTTNTGPMTLSIDGQAAVPIRKASGEEFPAGAIVAGSIMFIIYDGSAFHSIGTTGVGPAVETNASKVLSSADNNRSMIFTSNTQVDLQVPDGLDFGFRFTGKQAGDGSLVVNFTGTDTVISKADILTTTIKGSALHLEKYSATEWFLTI